MRFKPAAPPQQVQVQHPEEQRKKAIIKEE
jgi:hypothetical protein